MNAAPEAFGSHANEHESAWTSSFDRWRRATGFVVAAPLAFGLTYAFAADLTPSGRSMAAVMAAVVVLWITESIPLPVTALLGAMLCVLLGVADATTVFAHFANPIVFLFIGSFVLARAMSLHGLDRRIALSFLSLRWISASPARMLGGLGLVTATISMLISNTATTAMMLPIALGILSAVERRRDAAAMPPPQFTTVKGTNITAGMMLMVAYAASIGGIGTPVGSPPNLIAIGLIDEAIGVKISFLKWMLLAVPMLIAMGLALFAVLYLLHTGKRREEVGEQTSMADYIAQERADLGGWTSGQVNTLIAFCVAVMLWIAPGICMLIWDQDDPRLALITARLPESVAALIAAILLFVLPTNVRRSEFTLNWREAVKIDWGTILLFGGGLCFGSLMFETGVAEAIATRITHWTGSSSLWGLTAAAIAMGIVISEVTSNTAAANMIVPVVIALAQAANVHPLPPALGACLGASYGFMLPVSTPPNAIVYGSGLVPITHMIRAGLVFDLIGFAIILTGLRTLCPLFGWA